MNEQDFETWLESTNALRTTLINFSHEPFAADMLEKNGGIDKIIRAEEQMAVMIADACYFLSQHKAKALLSVKAKYPKMPSRERETLEEAEVAGIVRLIDGLKATENTFTSRRYNAPGKVR
jgi:hypothetical protein